MKGKIWLHGIIFGIIVTVTAVWFGMLPVLGAGIAGLNIAPEVPAMTICRHIVFGVIIGTIVGKKSKFLEYRGYQDLHVLLHLKYFLTVMGIYSFFL